MATTTAVPVSRAIVRMRLNAFFRVNLDKNNMIFDRKVPIRAMVFP